MRRAEGLKIAWFDQNRDKLDLEQPLKRALAPEGDTVIFRDRPVHVAGWAARFLFRQDQLELPLNRLSGGSLPRYPDRQTAAPRYQLPPRISR